jgi:ADP-heptose:LPS heptosyltransferase
MVADFKVLRAQIFKFEGDWKKKYNRTPKSSERGAMVGVYTHYKQLKSAIRDNAAIDMQRVARGFLVRRRLLRFAIKIGGKRGISKSVTSSFTPVHTKPKISTIPPDMYARYRELLSEKHELKRKLKNFQVKM